MSLDWLASLISFIFSLQLLQDDPFKKLAETVKEYPCAVPFWVGPFQASLFIYDPDYAKIFLNRTGKKSDESQEPHLARSDVHNPQARF